MLRPIKWYVPLQVSVLVIKCVCEILTLITLCAIPSIVAVTSIQCAITIDTVAAIAFKHSTYRTGNGGQETSES